MTTTAVFSFEQARLLLTPPPPSAVCYDLDAVETNFGVRYTPEQRDALACIPFSEKVLRESAGTHVLFPGFPLSIVEIREKRPRLFYKTKWYANESFARVELVRPSWHLLRMEPVPGSLGTSYPEQVALLGETDEMSRACEVTFAAMLHYLASRQMLFPKLYVRCSDVLSDGLRVYVGNFDALGFDASHDYWVDDRYDDVGLASSRKS